MIEICNTGLHTFKDQASGLYSLTTVFNCAVNKHGAKESNSPGDWLNMDTALIPIREIDEENPSNNYSIFKSKKDKFYRISSNTLITYQGIDKDGGKTFASMPVILLYITYMSQYYKIQMLKYMSNIILKQSNEKTGKKVYERW